MNGLAKQMNVETLTSATSLKFLGDDFPVNELYFNVDNEPHWIWLTEFLTIFTKQEFAETCSAFVRNLTNPSKFMNSKVVRKHEEYIPLELKLRAAMDKLVGESK